MSSTGAPLPLSVPPAGGPAVQTGTVGVGAGVRVGRSDTRVGTEPLAAEFRGGGVVAGIRSGDVGGGDRGDRGGRVTSRAAPRFPPALHTVREDGSVNSTGSARSVKSTKSARSTHSSRSSRRNPSHVIDPPKKQTLEEWYVAQRTTLLGSIDKCSDVRETYPLLNEACEAAVKGADTLARTFEYETSVSEMHRIFEQNLCFGKADLTILKEHIEAFKRNRQPVCEQLGQFCAELDNISEFAHAIDLRETHLGKPCATTVFRLNTDFLDAMTERQNYLKEQCIKQCKALCDNANTFLKCVNALCNETPTLTRTPESPEHSAAHMKFNKLKSRVGKDRDLVESGSDSDTSFSGSESSESPYERPPRTRMVRRPVHGSIRKH